MNDLRFAIRQLLKNPGFTAVAVLTLALGIGANTAIFSLVDAVLLKLLPVKNPEQLIVLDVLNQRGERNNFSYPMFERLRDGVPAFSGVFAALDGADRLDMVGPEANGQTEQAVVQLVSGEYFQVLGVNAVHGQVLTPEDNKTPGAHPVAVLSYGFWSRRFAGDALIIGKVIKLKDQPFTVIGVTAPGFFGESVGRSPDIWAPLMMQPSLDRGRSRLDQSNVGWLRVMARLRPGVTSGQAQAALDILLSQLKSEPTELGKWMGYRSKIGLATGAQGLSEFRNQSAQPLRILMAVVGLVLLVACANVANLLLPRGTAREREVAIRVALGAGRGRLIRQFVTESVVLAGIGGVLGLLFASWGGHVLLVMASRDSVPIPIDVTPDARILGFTIVVSLLTAILFGLAPALSAARQDLNSSLKLVAAARPRFSLPRLLVVAQVALSLLLLTGAGLFAQTLRNLRALELGFAAEHVVQVRIQPQSSGYKPEQIPSLHRRLLERLSSTPGIRSVSMSGSGFQTGTSRTCCIAVEGYTHRPGEDREVQTISVTPGFFQTLGLPLLRGRDFTPQDADGKPGEFPKLAIINETMARYYFGNVNPLGKRFGWGDPPQVTYDIEIVGVAKDAVYGDLRDPIRPLIYFPAWDGKLFMVRAAAAPASLATTIQHEIQAVDKSLGISDVRTIPQIKDQALVREKLLAKLSSFFGSLALLLSAIGLYGLMACAVARRTKEIGIRMALGAQRTAVVRSVMREALVLVLLGVAMGLVAALAATRLISSLLYGLAPTDPATIALAALVMFAVAALAAYVPARRASKVDPMMALRCE